MAAAESLKNGKSLGSHGGAVRRRDGRKTLGSSSMFFTRETCAMARKVTFDSRHRTIIDGKPFFPLGMYWGEISAVSLSRTRTLNSN